MGSRRAIAPRGSGWSELMRRAAEGGVLACVRCGGRMVVFGTIDDPAVIHRILMHRELSTEAG